MGSALARVRWELDINPRWEQDPSFYLDQTLTALLEALVQPPPFDASRSRLIKERMQEIAKILEDGKANLRAVRPFAALAIGDLSADSTRARASGARGFAHASWPMRESGWSAGYDVSSRDRKGDCGAGIVSDMVAGPASFPCPRTRLLDARTMNSF